MSDARDEHPLTGPVGLIVAILSILVIAFAWLWLTHRGVVVSLTLALRTAELRVISQFDSRAAALCASLHERDPRTIGLLNLYRLSFLVGKAYSHVAGAGLFVMAAIVLFCAPGQRYRRKLDLAGLILAQHDRFRTSRAFVGRKRVLRRPEFGKPPKPGDVSLHTDEWIAAFARSSTGEYSDEIAEASLVRQLGTSWTGVHDAAPHVRCLFAAFALQADRQRDNAVFYLGDLAVSVPPGDGDVPLVLPAKVIAQADRILADRPLVADCAKAAARHAYTTTAMMGVLAFTRRRSGTFSPGLFNWLKLVDRNLWYALVWPPNPYTEAGGVYAHYHAELEAGRPLFMPFVGPALRAIRVHQDKAEAAQRGK